MAQVQEDLYQGPDLREYLTILKTRKWTIIGVVVLVVTSAVLFSLRQTPLYTAEARLLLKQPVASNGTILPAPAPQTESEVVASEPVAALVADKLDLQTSTHDLLNHLDVATVTVSLVLTVSYTSEDPELARDASNAFAQGYIDYRVEQTLEVLRTERKGVEQRIVSLQDQLAKLIDDIAAADAAGNSGLVNTLETQRSTLVARLGFLEQQLDDLQPEGTARANIGEVIEAAVLPTSPSSPDHVQNIALALFLGLAVGVGLAFLRERLDDRFRGHSDVERATGAPVLATVPKFNISKKRGGAIAAYSEPKGGAAEAYRRLRTNLQFVALQREAKSLLVTSPSAGEGKTVSTANLAVALAQAGQRVIVVSADLRRPTIEDHFSLDQGARSQGLSTFLSGQDADAFELIRDPGIQRMRLLPSGRIPPNPAELLASPRLEQLVAELEEAADFVLFDSPPLLAVTDVAILAAKVHATLLVIDANSTHRSAALRAKEELERNGGMLLGSMLNAFDPSSSPYGYGYYGYYGYAAPPLTPNGITNGGGRPLTGWIGKVFSGARKR